MIILSALFKFVIIVSIFLLVLWFQYTDDMNRCKKRETFYSYIKLPLLIVCLIMLMFYYLNQNGNEPTDTTIMNESTVNYLFDTKNKDLLVYTELAEW